MKIQIKHRDGSVLFETDAENIGAAVAAARADLARTWANLTLGKLDVADLTKLLSQRTILPDGNLTGWKKLRNGTICKLLIPETAKRVGGLIGRKCRAEFATVLEGEGKSLHTDKFEYKVGETVKPDSYDPNPLVECSNGIHFYITREEAEAHI